MCLKKYYVKTSSQKQKYKQRLKTIHLEIVRSENIFISVLFFLDN